MSNKMPVRVSSSNTRTQPLAWHEENLRNLRTYKESKRLEIERVRAEFDRLVYDCLNYNEQIELAKAKGLTAFDRDRLGKKKST